jgi:hypothetical protein
VWSVVPAAVIGFSLIVCAALLAQTVVRVKSANGMIHVTGSARKQIQSDFIIWKGRIVSEGPDIAAAYRSLKTSVGKTKAYLAEKGVPAKEILDTPITTHLLYAPSKQPPAYPGAEVYRKAVGYQLAQEVEVRSNNVGLVDSLSRKSTELISRGVVFESEPPQYLYTKLGDLKITMLAEAAKDARARADQIARNSGCRLGGVRSAKMSPLRITPAFAVTEIDYMGTNDNTTLDKEITAVVSVSYAIR